MYLRGSKWNMTRKRRKRSNPWRILILLAMIAGGMYLNRVVLPNTDPLFVPTPTPTRSPESFVNEAQAFYRDGKIKQAIAAYEDAILADPENPSNYVELARIQILSGDYDEALKNAELALLLNPENPLAHSMRAWAQNFLGDPLEAEASIKKALDVDENFAIAHAIYAEILFDAGNFERGAEESRIALELDPNALEVRRARGYILYSTQNYAKAIEQFDAAIAINDRIPELYLLKGYAYYAMGEYDQAIDALNQANSLNPTDYEPDLVASRVYFTTGEFAKAAQYAEQALNDDPTNPRLRANLGVMLAKQGKPEDAIKQLALAIHGGMTDDGQVIEGLPLDYDLRIIEYYSTYGLTLARANRCNEAVPIFQAMLSLVPDNEIAVYNAEAGLEICQQNLDAQSPSATEEDTPEP
ncbi:MAG TPA: tetratricopeptide repeat protein [Anaerolineales bacterium]|nr:tetratricopeptide repeat protein [Anaerolineales bacterium]